MEIMNTGRRIMLDIFYKNGEKKMLLNTDDCIGKYLDTLTPEEVTCVIRYTCNQYFTGKAQSLCKSVFEVVKKKYPQEILQYIRLIKMVKKLDNEERDEDEDDDEYGNKYTI